MWREVCEEEYVLDEIKTLLTLIIRVITLSDHGGISVPRLLKSEIKGLKLFTDKLYKYTEIFNL